MIEKDLKVGKIHLHLREYPSSDDAVIFLHYGGGNLMVWNPVIPYFKGKFHLILPDLRGHGKSDRPSNGYHMDSMAEDIHLLLKNLNIRSAHIIGSSLGAEVGLSLAANYPEVVKSLVCEGALFNEFGPNGIWEGSDEKFKSHAMKTLEDIRNRPIKKFSSIDELVAEKQSIYKKRGWWNQHFEDVIRYGAIRLESGQYTECWGFIAEAYTKNYLYYQFDQYYRRVQCPVLFVPDAIPGQDEREKEIMYSFFSILKNGKITYIPEWVHPYGWLITPREVSLTILEFIRESSGHF